MTTMTTQTGRDGDWDWHRCHRADDDYTTDAVDCYVCGDTDDVRLCAPDDDPIDGCGEGYCPRHYTPAPETHGDEALRIWDAAKAAHKAAHN